MSKKRVKSGAGSAGPPKWDQAIVSAPFYEEGKWNAALVWVVGQQAEDYTHVSTLAAAVNSGARKLFSHITKDDLYEMVNDLGNPKSKKVKEIPANYEVCEPCKNYLDNNEDIPLVLLAKLIKFRLLDVKQKDIQRRDAEKKVPAAAGAADKGGKAGKGGKADKERAKSPAKGAKGGKKTPEPPSPKGETKLRRRGEEDTDSKYIDDEPDDGPEHYIFVSGFHQPQLLLLLSDLGINVDAIVKVKSDDYVCLQPSESAVPEVAEPPGEEQLLAEEEVQAKTAALRMELKGFWRDTISLLRKAPEGSKLHDLARLEYIVKAGIMPENPEDAEKKMEFGLALFEDMACLVYDLLDARRQWQNFLTSLHLVHVPLIGSSEAASQALLDAQSQHSVTPAPPAAGSSLLVPPGGTEPEPTAAKPDLDMRYYKELMDTVPQESASVPLILHSMLEQVCAWDEDREPPSEIPQTPRSDGLDDGVASHIGTVAFKLALSEEEEQILANELDPPTKMSSGTKTPLLIDHNDLIARRLHHLQPMNGFNPREIEENMLEKMSFLNKLQMQRPSAKAAQARAARLQELLHYCTNATLTQAEIEQAFKQFTLECLDLAIADDNGNVVEKGSPALIPWDDPYPVFSGVSLEDEEDATDVKKPDESAGVTIDQAVGGVQASRLQSELEALHLQTQATPPSHPRPESAASGRSSRSRGRNKKRKGGKSPTPPSATPPPVPPADESRPSSGGILKSPSRSGSLHSRRSSVHFETNDSGQALSQPGDTAELCQPVEMETSLEEVMHNIIDSQKRTLDQWCFTEHLEPKVLRQVLCEAAYKLPYMGTYYLRREHALLVVLHNPYNSALHSTVSWETKLHSNVGFRNYLEHIAGSIEEWTRDEEAKYGAELLAKEVDRIQKEADSASRPTSGTGKKGRDRSKSPRKAGSRTGRSSSRGSSSERPSSTSMFIREGSLKAQKLEMDALKAEQDEGERQKSEKRARSAAKKGKEKEEDKEKKKPGSRSSSKSQLSKEAPETEAVTADGEPKETEPQWPFMGYDVGNNMVHVGGTVTTMFPADGGQIKVEKTEFVHGTVSVNTLVCKDGHQFMVHVLDPKVKGQDEEEEVEEAKEVDGQEVMDEKPEIEAIEKPEIEAIEKPEIGRFGSLSVCFNDGMCLALSTYGSTGVPDSGKYTDEIDLFEMVRKLDVTAPMASQTPRSPSPGTKPESPSKGRKEKGKAATPEATITLEEGVALEEEKKEEPIPEQLFQQLYVTCPDGLCINYMLESALGIHPEDDSQRRLVVKQTYPFKTSGRQECEAVRKTAMGESGRIITSQGVVLRFMADGSSIVLYPDGKVSHLDGLPTTDPRSRASSPQRVGSAKSNAGGAETPTKKEPSDRKDTHILEKVVENLDQVEKSPRVRKGIMKNVEKSVDKVHGEKPDGEEDSVVRGKKSAQNKGASQDQPEEDQSKKGHWTTTLPSGERIAHYLDGVKIDVKDALLCVASDPQTKQTLYTREDHVLTVTHPDGSTVVEHSDGTRITSYSKEVEVLRSDESSQETGEPAFMEIREVRCVHVECPGYATVKFDTLTTECSTEFGSGSVIHTYPSGSYDIYHQGGGYLQVENDGTAVYNPKPNNELEIHNPDLDMRYLLRHFGVTLVETTDNEGNQFCVRSSGDTSVNLSGVGDTIHDADGEAPLEKQVVHYKQHAPRFFVVHGDGSGLELLRYQDVADYIATAEDDPSTAILMDPLQDHPAMMGITVMRPSLRGLSERWICNYSTQTIIPPGLTSRDLKTLPPREYKKEGPTFGTNVGQGLMVGSIVKSNPHPPVLKCPSVLEVRQLVQSKPVSQELRESLQKGLVEYGKFVRAQQEESEALLVQDPRSEEERFNAASMVATAPIQQENIKTLYEKATTAPLPEPCPTPQPKRSKADLERDVRELEEEKENRAALRKHDVPGYFNSELGKAFLLAQWKQEDEAPDVAELTKQLAVATLHGSPQGPSEPPTPDNAQTQDTSVHPSQQSQVSDRSISNSPPEEGNAISNASPYIQDLGSTPSAVRPGNPSPAHAAGQGSPVPLRPKNPTPSHANKTVVAERPGAPTPKEGLVQQDPEETPSSHVYPTIPEQPQEEKYAFQRGQSQEGSVMEPSTTTSLQVDVIGQPRRHPVPVPAYINSNGRPNAISNQKFGNVEDPVRRHIFTSSIAGASSRGAHTLARMRGFELLPNYINFGVLKEGNTYAFPVHLKNTGIDACRFKVKQPPPSTGLRVLFRPGPVAAGMKVELIMELYAIAVGVTGDSGVGRVVHNVEITTETDHLYLPVNATVLTAHEYEKPGPHTLKRSKAPGVKWISNRPPAGQGIIRPHRLTQGTEILMS